MFLRDPAIYQLEILKIINTSIYLVKLCGLEMAQTQCATNASREKEIKNLQLS